MKGVVFNLLEDVVTRAHGADVWDDLVDAAGVSGAYTSLGSYPDSEMLALVAAASEALKVPPNDVLRWFGKEAMPLLAERYPVFFEPHKETRDFIISVNSIIHPEVRKVYPGADVPVFEFGQSEAGDLMMTYRSHRKLCALAEGFAQGAAAQFSETVAFEHSKCMHDGHDACVISMNFQRLA
jgi:hypothetical protein